MNKSEWKKMIKSLQKISKISFKKDPDLSSEMFFYPGGTYLSFEFSKKNFGFGSIGLSQSNGKIMLSNEMMSRQRCANFIIAHIASLPLSNGIKIHKKNAEKEDINRMKNNVANRRLKSIEMYQERKVKEKNQNQEQEINGYVTYLGVSNKIFNKETNKIEGMIDMENQNYLKVELDLSKMETMRWFDFFRNKWMETNLENVVEAMDANNYFIGQNEIDIIFSMVFCENWLRVNNKKTEDFLTKMEVVEVSGLFLPETEISMNTKEMRGMKVSIIKDKEDENFHFDVTFNGEKHKIVINTHSVDEPKKIMSIDCPTDINLIPKVFAKIVNEMVLEDEEHMTHSCLERKLLEVKECYEIHQQLAKCLSEDITDVAKYLKIENFVKETIKWKSKVKMNSKTFDDFMIRYERFFKDRV